MKQYKNTVNTSTSTHTTKTPTHTHPKHYKTHTYTHHILKKKLKQPQYKIHTK